MRALVISGLVGLAWLSGGCKDKELAYHRLELPGFSVEVPTQVTFSGDAKALYRTGQVQAQIGLEVVSVSWQVGPIATEQEIPALAQALAAALPNGTHLHSEKARTATVAGHKATWLDARIETADLTFVDIECGARSVMIAVGAATDAEAMRSRVLPSFVCTPIEAEEKALASAVPIAVDDPAALKGWYRMPNQDAFTLTNGTLLVLFTEAPPTMLDSSKLGQMLPTMFAAAGGTWTSLRHERRASMGGDRDVHFGTLTMDGSTTSAALSLVRCDDARMVMGLVMPPDGGELEAGVDLLAKVRCSLPGDGPLPLETLPSEPTAEPAPPK